MSIRTVRSLRSSIAGSGSLAVGGSYEATFFPAGSSAQTMLSYQLPVAGNGARSFHSGYTPSSAFSFTKVGALVAFAAIACSSFMYTMGAEKAACQPETGEEESGEEPEDDFARNNKGFRWDKFHEYMSGKDDDLPDYVDWEEAGAVTPSMNQLKCGACTAFATISCVEGVYWMKSGKLYMCREGVTRDAHYPYMGMSGPCRSKVLPVAARINGYFSVYVGGDERELMRAVAKQPVEITICTTGSFVEYKGGCTLEPEDFNIGEDTQYDHSVLLVCYGVDNDGPYWRIKNSWGPDWGDRGFAKLRRGVKDPNGTGGMTRPGAFAFFPVMD